jgi:predicted RNA binding protein YcfA (HicA-like mRNA interferase family)
LTRLPHVRGVEVLNALKRGGFVLTHVRGSHHYLRKPGQSALVTVPVHGSCDLPVGTLRAILRQADLSVDEFLRLLDGK